ncbi:MAG: CHAD domain-containing protein, partial [Anaerolineales bacterium]
MDHQASSVQPDKKKSPGVLADEPMAEAGRKMLGFHFARMLAHEAGTRAGLDVEALHDMRVATRRQRAAFRLFAPYFDLARIRPFRRALRALAQRLGAVRDWDVLTEAVRAYQAALGAQAGAL